MLTLTQLPIEFRGSLYFDLMQNDPTDDTVIPKILKTDQVYENLGDILRQIDTCCYLGCELPHALYAYLERECGSLHSLYTYLDENYKSISREIERFNDGKIYKEYEFFKTTPEFRAVKIYAKYFHDVMRDRDSDKFPSRLVFTTVAQNNSLLILKYLEETENLQYNAEDMKEPLLDACRCGSNDILEYWSKMPWFAQIIGNTVGCPTTYSLSERMCSETVCSGHLSTLKFLRERLQLKWSVSTINAALLHSGIYVPQIIQHNRIQCVKYAVENGCPYDQNTFNNAIKKGELEIIKILHSAGGVVFVGGDTYDAYLQRNLEILKNKRFY